MSLIEAIVLGIVQGLTEFLPISSTAHLRIVPALFGWRDPGAAFSAVIQIGTLAAVLVYFRADILRIVRAVLVGLWRRNPLGSDDARLGWMIALGTLPIVVGGLAFKQQIETTLRSLYVICASLIVVGLAMEMAEHWMLRRQREHRQKSLENVGWPDAALVGLAQALALVPGASRSGVTITAGLFRGLDRATAARFSFLLSLPSIFAAGVYQLAKQWKPLTNESQDAVNLAVATAVAGIVGYAAIAFLLRYLRTRSMRVFVVYRIALAAVLLGLLWSGRISSDGNLGPPAESARQMREPGKLAKPGKLSEKSIRPLELAALAGGKSAGSRFSLCVARQPHSAQLVVPGCSYRRDGIAVDGEFVSPHYLAQQFQIMPTTRRRPTSAVQSPLETYLREINETSLLNAAQEKELAVAIGQGNVEARDRMVRANLRLVVNIARGYAGKGLGLQDLIEEGNLGLLRAVEGFDPAMGTRFSTYASYWIKQSIKRALINSGKTIRIPAYMVELLSKWRRATARLSEELGRSPTPEEVGRVLGLPRKKLSIIKKAIRIYNSTPQTDQPEAGWSLGEMVMDEGMKAPEELLMNTDNLQHVMRMLQTMDPREATVLRMRFGLDDNEPRTLKEIGESLGLTRERVRQIETEALHKLAMGLEGEGEFALHHQEV